MKHAFVTVSMKSNNGKISVEKVVIIESGKKYELSRSVIDSALKETCEDYTCLSLAIADFLSGEMGANVSPHKIGQEYNNLIHGDHAKYRQDQYFLESKAKDFS